MIRAPKLDVHLTEEVLEAAEISGHHVVQLSCNVTLTVGHPDAIVASTYRQDAADLVDVCVSHPA